MEILKIKKRDETINFKYKRLINANYNGYTQGTYDMEVKSPFELLICNHKYVVVIYIPHALKQNYTNRL
jgi:hypothetical protein